MTGELQEIIEDTIELTGAAAPAVLADDAPVLQVETSTAAGGQADEPLYLVGLIGGKEVGKSSLVNALVGQTISEPTASGPGTEQVIAYAHHSAAAELRELLERITPGQYRIVPHNVNELSRQVLVDLPDIDSHWTQHLALTRRMLRHLLFPLWMQSIEKYADIQPQKLLAQVAEGNDPANFVFCLNKADQLRDANAAEELRGDYAQRLRRTLALASEPRVYLISAQQPATLDLPELRAMLSRQKSTTDVRQSMRLAQRRKDQSVLSWLESQRLGERASAERRLLDEARDLLMGRLAVPLLETQLPRIEQDPGYQMSIVEPAVQRRLSHWPLLNIVHTAMLPAIALVQKNVAGATPLGGIAPASLQSVFARLHQSHPDIARAYQHRRLWEDYPAAVAVAELRNRIEATMDRQASAAVEKAGGGGVLLAPLRWLLTIGALLWFPIIQPLAAAMLAPGWAGIGRDFLLLAVQLISAAYLIRGVGFVLIYFFVLWAVLRWDTRRKVEVLLRQWSRVDAEPELSFEAAAMQWLTDLLVPLQRRVEVTSALAERVEKLRGQLESAAVTGPDRA
jgi:hypothetical protein